MAAKAQRRSSLIYMRTPGPGYSRMFQTMALLALVVAVTFYAFSRNHGHDQPASVS
jgi:hypothetical protein